MTVELGTETFPARGVAEGAEREEIWERQKQRLARLRRVRGEDAGIREIPVVVLEKTRA